MASMGMLRCSSTLRMQQQARCSSGARGGGGAARSISSLSFRSSSSSSSMPTSSRNRQALATPLHAFSPPLSAARGCGMTSTSYNQRSISSIVARATKKDQERRPSIPSSSSSSSNKNDLDLDLDLKKGSLLLLRWSLYTTQKWDVPWSGKQTAITMFAWIASFVAVGASLAPLAAAALGAPNLGALSAQDKSLFLLVNQIVETAVGLSIVNATVSKYPKSEVPRDLLRVDFRRPFSFDQRAAVDSETTARDSKALDLDLDLDDDDGGRAGGGWLSWALVGIVASPVVIGAAATAAAALSDLSGGATSGGRGTADAVAGLLDASSGRVDVPTLVSLLIVTAVFAPILEETVFRGFLLPSLTKVMPVPAAIVVSAAGFATAHLSARDFPQLFAFGILLGFVYVRSRNLLSTMFIHGAWNGGVLLLLAVLASSGVDLEKLLAS